MRVTVSRNGVSKSFEGRDAEAVWLSLLITMLDPHEALATLNVIKTLSKIPAKNSYARIGWIKIKVTKS